MQRHHCRINGFTLIELLLVVAIIAVLIAMLLPSLSIAREQADRTVCAAHLQNIYLGAHYYAQDNYSYFPPPSLGEGTPAGMAWDCRLAKYLDITAVMMSDVLDPPQKDGLQLLQCPSDPLILWEIHGNAVRRSYSLCIMNDLRQYSTYPSNSAYNHPHCINWYRYPSESFLFGEEWSPVNLVGTNLGSLLREDRHYMPVIVNGPGYSRWNPAGGYGVGRWHDNKGANWCYTDGHATFVAPVYQDNAFWLDPSNKVNH